MHRWIHSIITLGAVAVGISTPSIQAAVSAHPIYAIVGGALWAIAGHFLPSPIAALFGTRG
jgi:hypothetical protein